LDFPCLLPIATACKVEKMAEAKRAARRARFFFLLKLTKKLSGQLEYINDDIHDQ
jgi:hypothetical protein